MAMRGKGELLPPVDGVGGSIFGPHAPPPSLTCCTHHTRAAVTSSLNSFLLNINTRFCNPFFTQTYHTLLSLTHVTLKTLVTSHSSHSSHRWSASQSSTRRSLPWQQQQVSSWTPCSMRQVLWLGCLPPLMPPNRMLPREPPPPLLPRKLVDAI